MFIRIVTGECLHKLFSRRFHGGFCMTVLDCQFSPHINWFRKCRWHRVQRPLPLRRLLPRHCNVRKIHRLLSHCTGFGFCVSCSLPGILLATAPHVARTGCFRRFFTFASGSVLDSSTDFLCCSTFSVFVASGGAIGCSRAVVTGWCYWIVDSPEIFTVPGIAARLRSKDDDSISLLRPRALTSSSLSAFASSMP